MYDLVKSVRNLDLNLLKERLSSELERLAITQFSPFSVLHRMDNWGFYHYLFARLLYKNDRELDFSTLLRSKKQSSLILFKFLDFDDKPAEIGDVSWHWCIESVAGHCLVKRNDLDEILSMKGIDRVNYLIKQNYLHEMYGIVTDNLEDFINIRDKILRERIDELIVFKT